MGGWRSTAVTALAGLEGDDFAGVVLVLITRLALCMALTVASCLISWRA